MLDEPLPQQNKWVSDLFEKVLKLIKDLELTQDSPSIFLVYAHDSQGDKKRMPK